MFLQFPQQPPTIKLFYTIKLTVATCNEHKQLTGPKAAIHRMEERLHLKGLNGLRAISAIAVVVAHIHLIGFPYNHLWPRWFGTYAVTIFFTLSGFLITYLLLTEKKRTAGISIRNFYIRRALRIWPLYFAWLLVTLLIIWMQSPEKLPGSLPYYLFFAANIPNILSNSLPWLGHYWSLGVEEQFYFFWPWLIKKPANALKAMLIFLGIFMILRLIARYLYLHQGYFIPINFLNHTRFDCMAIGGIGAFLCFTKNKLFLRLVINRITELLCWLCLCLVAASRFNITPFLDHDLVSLMALGLMANGCFARRPLISLENRFFDITGRISYGIYIIHPLVIFGLEALLDLCNITLFRKNILLFFGALLCTVGIAWLLHEYFEKWFLRLKNRFTVVKNSG